jgi:hypothetical protein
MYCKEDICMEKSLILTIQLIFFGLIALTGLAILIFYLRKHDEGYDYDKIIKMMNEQTGQNLDVLSKVNREKDRIEEKIRKRKKELGMSLIYNQK